MKRMDRAAGAALSLTGLIMAAAVGVAITAAARTPGPADTGVDAGRTIALVGPEPSTAATAPEIDPPVTTTQPPARVRIAAAPVTVTSDTRGDGTPEDSPSNDRSGHRGGDDDAKSNSGPGNYEHNNSGSGNESSRSGDDD